VQTEDEAYYAWVLAALVPWTAVEDPRPTGSNRKTAMPLQALVIQEGLKGTTKLRDLVAASCRNRQEIVETVATVCAGDICKLGRDKIGMAIRRWEQQGGHWKLQVLHAMLAEAPRNLAPIPTDEGSYQLVMPCKLC
jgi:tRNA nucleotidyltransferase (CCA-adding enzyme)